jgi:hypothetical protein
VLDVRLLGRHANLHIWIANTNTLGFKTFALFAGVHALNCMVSIALVSLRVPGIVAFRGLCCSLF